MFNLFQIIVVAIYLILPFNDHKKFVKYKELQGANFEEFSSRNAKTLDEETFLEKLESEEWLSL